MARDLRQCLFERSQEARMEALAEMEERYGCQTCLQPEGF
jgi:hypothetical protein